MSYTFTIANNLLAQSTNIHAGNFYFNGVKQTGMGQQTRPVIYPTGPNGPETIPALLCIDWGSNLEFKIAWEEGDPGWPTGTQVVGTCALPIPGTNSLVKFGGAGGIPAGPNSVILDVFPSTGNRADLMHAFLCPPISWNLLVNNTPIPLTEAVLEVYFVRAADITSFVMTAEQARFLAARDLAKPFLTTSTPSAQESAAASVQGAFLAPPVYSQLPNYNSGAEGFELTDWLFALSGINPSPLGTDCSTSAAMCSLVLQLQQNPAVQQVWCGTIDGWGAMDLIANTKFRGGGTPYSTFSWHDVILYSCSEGIGVCDATVGPHIGNETPDVYVQNTFSNPQNVPSPEQPG